MNKILIAVDGTEGTRDVFEKTMQICKRMNPEQLILIYVEKLEASPLMDVMLGDSELAELKEAMEGTEFKEALDKKAKIILKYYRQILESAPPLPEVKTVIRTGHPAEEILKGAESEGADLIVIASRGDRIGRLFMGSVSREVANNASVPVLLVR
jgi:nucleotide-binding universal stress UspA family protein